MSEKKVNKKMSAARTVKIKKMSARMSSWLYLKAKFIAESQGLTMEQKITELIKKDIAYVINQKWFIDYMKEEGIQDFNTFGMPSSQQKRHVKEGESGEGSVNDYLDLENLDGDDEEE